MFTPNNPLFRVFTLAVCTTLLPAALLLTFAVLRSLQPPQYEPAHTSWIIVDWTTTHVSRLGAGILFLGMPALAVFLGGAVLPSVWRGNSVLRHDHLQGLGIMRRQLSVGLLATATLVGAAILALGVSHLFVD